MLRRSRFAFLPFVGLMSACGAESPLRPTEESSTPTAPRLVQPGQGAAVALASPLVLTVENATVSPAQPLSYTFEVATDASFATRVFVQDAVPQGEDGRTSVTVTTALAPGTSYVWRARASSTTAAGPAAEPWSFTADAARSLGAPVVIEPSAGFILLEPHVVFRVGQGERTGAFEGVHYRIEIGTDEALSNLVAVLTVPEQGAETRVAFDATLELGRTYYWRVKASTGGADSEWTAVTPFRAPSVKWPTTGEEVIAFVEARYPAWLEPTGSLAQRQANMAFLRDRMIEAGICGGMDLGWNLKRGGPEVSIDFLTQRVNGRLEGIDIGHDYDNHGKRLALTWYTGEFPFYATYQPRPTCQ